MDACLLHCIAHVAHAAARIRRNNERAKSGDIDADAEARRDQGFTRAKVRVQGLFPYICHQPVQVEALTVCQCGHIMPSAREQGVHARMQASATRF